ncbi:recombinase family protein [Roseiarcaceae bacterium H3SJ34-1]|uniref:recombinase family protein n=1 Tax=Terripilifer ovatus TaxID=3032367 RepID=UPI003AB9ACA2|nr:recombinase family protein [Roseiarcaceae bacterium H3SJ34-1]
MKALPSPKAQRCAIYTRKSTDHNLDLAFNSLDAQREACEAYIKSQAHEGWSLVRDRFDDGAFSGASLDRPALQALLDIVRLKKVDIIVVYKVDRLTRSLADFAKLVELFDERGVSFVSVTQSFNTTSSMGRLTLNVLLSFAQFEREVIGERVRDKISASKRRGIWVGGPVPLGYRSVNKKLEIVPEEVDLVRRIFQDYLRLGSITALIALLTQEGLRPKPRILANGSTVAPTHYRVGPLAHLLKNRFYIGDVVYQGEINKGEHQPILDRELFDAVQARIASQAVARTTRRATSTWLLTGIIFDDRGHRMSPSHSNKNGVRYRFYVSQALTQGRKAEAGSLPRVSASAAERTIVEALREREMSLDGTPTATGDPPTASDYDLIRSKVRRVVVGRQAIMLTPLDPTRPTEQLEESPDPDRASVLTIPFRSKPVPKKGIAREATAPHTIDANSRKALLRTIARSRRWIDDLISGSTSSFADIATREGLVERHVRFLAPLAFLAPKIIAAIADGSLGNGVTASSLARSLSMSWGEQAAILD